MLHSANTDALTGLYNRRYFYAALDKNRNRERVSLLYLDIDNFKSVNDRYGHQCGDQALIVVARLPARKLPR
ncbi:MAG: GGDEF domain-containing protein [Bilophila sp.]